jgi:glycerophosphoryl diester phosphodiesterase
MKKDLKIIAHRGYSSLYPDNTMESFEQAVKAGADVIETDIREAKDGSLICSHDPTNKAALSFSDALDFAKDKITLLLDLKVGNPAFHAKLVKELKDRGMEGQVIIGVRSLEQAREIKALLPDTQMLGFLKNPSDFPEFFKIGGTIARLWENDVNGKNLALAKTDGHPVFVMSGSKLGAVGDITPDRLRKLMSLDVQGILVNDPKLAIQVKNEKPRPPSPPGITK